VVFKIDWNEKIMQVEVDCLGFDADFEANRVIFPMTDYFRSNIVREE
jgi:hypothetical protein